MEETISDINLKLEWSRTGQDLKVWVPNGGLMKVNVLLYNSVTGYVDPLLSARQVKWITEHYQQKRKNYVFA